MFAAARLALRRALPALASPAPAATGRAALRTRAGGRAAAAVEAAVPRATAAAAAPTLPLRDLRTGNAVGAVTLPADVFAVPLRIDILHRVVVWQLAKRRQGTHKTKGRSEVRGSTRKVYAQKKTGRARHGTIRAPIFRHGGIAHGPVVRSHAFKLPKKVRALGLKVALSAKAAEPGALWIVPPSTLPSERKTSVVAKLVRQHGWGKGRTVVFVGPNDLDLPFLLASRNLRDFDVLRAPGLNVYDIVRARRVILTTDAVRYIAARFGTTVVEAPPATTQAQAEAQAETATG